MLNDEDINILTYRFTNILRNAYDPKVTVERLNSLIADAEMIFDIPISNSELLDQFKENHAFEYNLYLSFIEERERVQDDLVLD